MACSAFPPKAPDECAAWNIIEFFEKASVETVRACFAPGWDANAANDRERTPLMMATALGKEEQAPLHYTLQGDVQAPLLAPLLAAGRTFPHTT